MATLIPEYTETELANGCAKGKSHYQEALYMRFYKKMFAVSLRYTGDKDVAGDILHESFLKVFQSIGNFRGTGSLEGWIRRIVVNNAIEYHRKKSRMYALVDIDKAVNEDSGHDLVAQMSSDEIMKLIMALPDGYRTIFNLFVIEGYSHKEIADMLDISEGTSKSQLARARQTLQQQILKERKEYYGKAE